MLAWNYYDAGIMDDPKLSEHMTDRERYYAEPHREHLSLQKWLNYFYFIGSAITPMHEYRDFEEFINYRGNITKMPRFGNVVPAFRRFIETWICITILLILNSQIDREYMLTPEFADESIFYKVAFLIASMHIKIYSLYTAFATIEAIFIVTGLSYTPKTEKTKEDYNSTRAVRMIDFELSLTGFQSLERWNMFT